MHSWMGGNRELIARRKVWDGLHVVSEWRVPGKKGGGAEV